MILNIFKIMQFKKIYLIKILVSLISGVAHEQEGFILSNYGVFLKKNFSDRTFRLCLQGYRNGLEIILRDLKQEFIFIDVGANQGIFSILASKNSKCTQIHAFEPNPKLMEFLEKNFMFNKVKNSTIHQLALSNLNGKVNFSTWDSHSGIGRIDAKNGNILVDVVNRKYLNKVFRNSLPNMFLKIDAEGSELIILKEFFGSKVASSIKFIFIEIDPKFNQSKEVTQLLSQNGFTLTARASGGGNFDHFYTKV